VKLARNNHWREVIIKITKTLCGNEQKTLPRTLTQDLTDRSFCGIAHCFVHTLY